MRAQLLLEDRFDLAVPLSGFYDNLTRQLVVIALQLALNRDQDAQLIADGILSAKTLEAFGEVTPGSVGNKVWIVQLLLMLNDYPLGKADGLFGPDTEQVVKNFQQDKGLTANGIVDSEMLISLVGAQRQPL